MADVITRFRLETTQYDSKLRDAAKGLKEVVRVAELGGKDFKNFSDKAIENARALGQTASGATNAKDRLKDLVGSFNEAAKAYNRLSQAQQQSDFGKALSQSLEQLQQRIKQTKDELYNLGDAVNGKSGGLFGGDKLSGMLQVFGGNVMTKVASVGIGLVGELKDAVSQGIELAKQGEGIRIAFERLGRGDILQGLREATHGTVTDLELMKAAVKFNDFKLPLDELGTMLAFAQQKAKDTGQSVYYMVDSIVTGLGRKSLMILDNLGLSAAEIRDKMKETGDMTKAVGEIIREQMAKAGDYVETAADRATQANVNLQNKMEELGRKFAPLEEASNNFWTSMKIGILDVVGGPLTNLLNKLTEAGRLMGAYGKLGGNTKANRMIANLAGARQENRQSIYQQQQSEIWKYINPREQQLKDIRAWQRGERNDALKGRIQSITAQYGSLDATKIQAEVDAAKKMLAEYQQAARSLLTPVKADIKTDEAEQNVASLTKKLKELQEQRKKAIQAKDKGLSADLLKQINQVKSEIKGLDPNALKTGGAGSNPVKQAADKVATAQHEYAQSIEQAKMSLDNGTKTEADYKKQLLSAEERLWNALGDAYNTHKDPKYKQAQDECAAKIKALGGEVTASIEAQKKTQESSRLLEAAQKKLADAQTKLAEARSTGDLKQIYTAEKNVETARKEVERLTQVVDVKPGKVGLPDVPKEVEMEVKPITYTSGNLDAFISNLKQQLSTADVGSELYNNLTAQMADATTLGNLIETAIKNGVDAAQFDPQALWRKVFGDTPGDYISDDTWQGHISTLNQQINGNEDKEGRKKTRTRFKLDNNTGEIKKDDKEEKRGEETLQGIQTLTGSVQGILDGINKLGFEIPEEITEVLGVLQTIASIMSAIQTISTLKLFANGGIVPHAAGGTVAGTHYSGDVTPILANAGEVVLNRAQVGNLASTLQGGGLSNLQLEAIVRGEDLRFVLNSNGRRTGRGEIVTTNFR